jgi:DNA-binding CsgD family transcriptional regulator
MEPLTFNDTQSLLQGIQTLYTFCNLETFAVDVLAIVDQLVPSNIPTFHTTEMRTRQVSHTFLPDCPGFGPELDKVIDQHFGEHPIVHNMPKTLHGAYQLSDFVNQKELQRLEGLYQQFLRPLDQADQMTFFLPNTNSGSWSKLTQADVTLVGFSLNRPHNFTERDRLILNLLRPHLSQAYSNAQQYQQYKQELGQLHQTINHLGLVVLSHEGRVQRVTPPAMTWLEAYFPKPTSTSQLPDHLWSWVKHQITQNSGLPEVRLPLHIEQNGKQLVIRLVVDPIAAQYLLLFEEQTLSSLQSLELLGLSQRETEVLFWIMRGKDNKAIAAQLAVGPSTVRKHLESIYRKLGVQSRTEAIAQTLEKLGLLNPLPWLDG